MRRLALLTAVATFAVVAVAMAAAPSSTLTVKPNAAGSGTKATLDIKLAKAKPNPRFLTLRVVRGAKFDPRAVATKCTKQQATANNCPASSRIGGGTNTATASSTTTPPAFPPQQITITTDLYLMAPLQQGDLAGTVAIYTAPGEKGHAFARITKIPQGKFGIQTKYTHLDTALTAPSGTSVHVDHIHLTYGVSRTVKVNGKPTTFNLITNPKTCSAPWPYELVIGYPSGTPSKLDSATPCKP